MNFIPGYNVIRLERSITFLFILCVKWWKHGIWCPSISPSTSVNSYTLVDGYHFPPEPLTFSVYLGLKLASTLISAICMVLGYLFCSFLPEQASWSSLWRWALLSDVSWLSFPYCVVIFRAWLFLSPLSIIMWSDQYLPHWPSLHVLSLVTERSEILYIYARKY